MLSLLTLVAFMKYLPFLLILLAVPVYAHECPPFSICGHLLVNCEPVEGVRLNVTKKECGEDDYIFFATSGSDGIYLMGGLEKGKYVIAPEEGWIPDPVWILYRIDSNGNGEITKTYRETEIYCPEEVLNHD